MTYVGLEARLKCLELPLLIRVIGVAGHEGEGGRNWMNGNALLMCAVDDRQRVFFILPRTVNRSHSAECEFDSLRVSFDASLANSDLAGCIQSNELVIAIAVTVLDSNQARWLSTHCIHALCGSRILQFTPEIVRWQLRVLIIHIIRHIIHIPLERFAIQLLLQCQLRTDVAHLKISRHWLARVEIFFVLIIEPSLNHTFVVDSDQRALLLLSQLSEIVRHESTVDMADSAAWDLKDSGIREF